MPKSYSAISFQLLYGMYPLFRLDSLNRGLRGFNSDVWLLFSCVVSVGGYGLTCRGCCKMVYASLADSNLRSIRYRLKWLVDGDYVITYRYKGRVRYKISSHAEKLIVKSLGKDVIRNIALFVKDSIKE